MRKQKNKTVNIRRAGKLPVGQRFTIKEIIIGGGSKSEMGASARRQLGYRPRKGDSIPLYSGMGHCRFVDALGTDKRIVEAARVSYLSKSKGEEADRKLLRYLLLKRHTSPFEQCSITFNIKMPIFVMRQFVRHRMFRLNEVSARYTELPGEMYVPRQFKRQAVKNKQGSRGRFSDKANFGMRQLMETCNSRAYDCYKLLLEQGVSKELARCVLPVSTFTEIYVNCDLHNLMHFLRLREHKHAQEEIRWVANAMHDIARRLFPWTFEVFDRTRLSVRWSGPRDEKTGIRVGTTVVRKK